MFGRYRWEMLWLLMACVGWLIPGLPLSAGEAPLQQATRWLGNTYHGGNRDTGLWMQQKLEDILLMPDGRILTNSEWDEASHGFAWYDGKTGKPAGTPAKYAACGGRALACDGKYIFVARFDKNTKSESKYAWHGVSRYKLEGGPAPWPEGNGGDGSFLPLHEKIEWWKPNGAWPLNGLAAVAGELFVADPNGRRVRIFDAETMAAKREFALEPETDTPGRILAAPDGNLWIAQFADGTGRVRLYDAQGKFLDREINDIEHPAAMAWDRDGKLIIADASRTRDHLRWYDLAGDQPKLAGTFGGSVFAEPNPGVVAPDRFWNITGVAVGTDGGLFVSTYQPGPLGGTAILRKFDTERKLVWQNEAIEFFSNGCADPASPNTVYTLTSRFEIDPGTPTQDGWPHAGWKHAAWTLNPAKYPDDVRLSCAQRGVITFNNNGHRYLMAPGSSPAGLWRFDGEIAVPVALFALMQRGWIDHWPANLPLKECAWLWSDGNGDGQMQPDEYQKIQDGEHGGYWYIDDELTVWRTGGWMWRFKPESIDERGIPHYNAAKKEEPKVPADVHSFGAMRYLPAQDVFVAFTIPKTAAQTMKLPWYCNATELRRYSGWKDDKPELVWSVPLPWRDTGNRGNDWRPAGLDVAGEYVFVAMDWSSDRGREHGQVLVYRLADGSYVGRMFAGPEVGGSSGCIDISNPIGAVRRADGTYLVFVEDDEYGKVLCYVWKP